MQHKNLAIPLTYLSDSGPKQIFLALLLALLITDTIPSEIQVKCRREKSGKKPKSYSSKRPGNQTLLNNLQKDLDELAQSEKDRDRAKMDQAVIDLKASVQKMSVNLDDFVAKDGKMSKNLENQIEGMADKVSYHQTLTPESMSKSNQFQWTLFSKR